MRGNPKSEKATEKPSIMAMQNDRSTTPVNSPHSDLIECVPNVSEGRHLGRIKRIADAITSVSSVQLLHVDSGTDANRTVFSFVGPPEPMAEAAMRMTREAVHLIDMKNHRGRHTRNGAVDVLPFAPLHPDDMPICVSLARSIGSRIATELRLPCYLYGEAALAHRRSLSAIRKGQYEKLPRKLSVPEWQPDFGSTQWTPAVARSGSVQIGARPLLIALNLNLNTRDVSLAKNIARTVRTSGFPGSNRPGLFSHLMADGWYMNAYGLAQITMNLTDYRITPPHTVFRACQDLAISMNTRIIGAELIGLIPKQAMVDAGRFFLNDNGLSESDAIASAIEHMGLNSVKPFVPSTHILEVRMDQSSFSPRSLS